MDQTCRQRGVRGPIFVTQHEIEPTSFPLLGRSIAPTGWPASSTAVVIDEAVAGCDYSTDSLPEGYLSGIRTKEEESSDRCRVGGLVLSEVGLGMAEAFIVALVLIMLV
jgi:hypothetical protein